jgi:phage-related minor tail protein
MSGSLETMFMDIVKGTATVGDAFRKMASDIIAEMFRVMMVQHWVSSIMGTFGSLFSTGFSPASGSISSAVPGSFNVAGKRAAGGPVTGGKTYLVGEQGPELFSPSVSGSITSNGDMGGGGGVVIEQHFHISTGVQETVRAEIMGMMPVFKRQAVAAVEDARRRGQTK